MTYYELALLALAAWSLGTRLGRIYLRVRGLA